MKSKLLLISLIGLSFGIKAQNTFPSNGNVGIGTTTPSTTLDVRGNVNLNNQYSTAPEYLNSGYYVYKSGSVAYGMKLQYTSGKFGTMIFGPNQSNRFIGFGKVGNELKDNKIIEFMRIDLNSGNLGIGTENPKSKLDFGSNYSDPSTYPNKITLWSGGENNYFGFGISNGDLDYISQGNHRFYTGYNGTSGSEKMVIKSNGNVGIGTTDPSNWKLAVNGEIRAKEIKVETGWSDFVFYDDYKLPTLKEVENHINETGHLKDIPSAKEVAENGIFLGEMDSKLLQKIEELTLYTISQEKKINKQNSKLIKQEQEITELKSLNKKLLDLQKRLEILEKK
ncbi:hypothetical protein [Tenacibaculum halocynthiae]|uniref:hypothetical protein n=1 Tax=Tenacibaculum halocynthiae TaxID=1254437 RepID=UPI003893D7A1